MGNDSTRGKIFSLNKEYFLVIITKLIFKSDTGSILEEDIRLRIVSSTGKNSKKDDQFLRKRIKFLEQSLKNRVITKLSQTLQG